MVTECTRAAEAVNRETKQLNPEPVTAHQLIISKQSKQAGKYHRSGKQGHTETNCIHRDKCCHYCQNVGHLSLAGIQRKQDSKAKEHKNQNRKTRCTYTVDAMMSISSDEEFNTKHNHVYHTAGSQGHIKKSTTTLTSDGVKTLMEIDTGAECSTTPFSLHKEWLVT